MGLIKAEEDEPDILRLRFVMGEKNERGIDLCLVRDDL